MMEKSLRYFSHLYNAELMYSQQINFFLALIKLDGVLCATLRQDFSFKA